MTRGETDARTDARRGSTGCGRTEEEVLEYVEGTLAEDDELRWTLHLAECGECREKAVGYRALGAILEACAREPIRWSAFDSPFGTMYASTSGCGLARVSWGRPEEDFLREMRERFPDRRLVRDPGELAHVQRQLRQYFAGDRSTFDLPVDLSLLTDFEQRVLEAARGIPYGEVTTYSDVAQRIGRPRAARAVGNALGANPVAIVVPCHRVVRKDGSLGGYGGGEEYKERLLELEGAA